MEWVVITTEAVEDGLLRGSLVTDDPVRLPVLGNWLRAGRRRDRLPKASPGDFCPEVEGRALRARSNERQQLFKAHTHKKSGVGCSPRIDEQALRFDNHARF